MGDGMTCATTEKCSGAVVAQVAQKAGLRHCATTLPPKGGIGWGGASGALALRWRTSGGVIPSHSPTQGQCDPAQPGNPTGTRSDVTKPLTGPGALEPLPATGGM
jgi:hypothetical protein